MSRVDGAHRRAPTEEPTSQPEHGARSGVEPTTKRRDADASAEERRNRHYTDAGPPATSTLGGARFSSAPSLPASWAIAAIVRPEREPAGMPALAAEVLRLRAEGTRTREPELGRAIAARVATLSSEWRQLARAKGMQPPDDTFAPFRATDEELTSAILWTFVGDRLPVSAFQDSGARYRDELLLAHAVRSPTLLPALADTKDPRLAAALYKELERLGDARPCAAGDTIPSLLARRAELLRLRDNGAAARADDEARKQITLGADGRVGAAESIALYEMEQHILAANPGTTLGAILAATQAGDLEGMRRAGQAGNMVEGVAGGFGRAKHADLPKVGRAPDNVRP
ncbi:MAG: hypothetical protein KF850_37820 [Labilithrix sp.]|nr:hypothetical protein [Labilithrix sp.]